MRRLLAVALPLVLLAFVELVLAAAGFDYPPHDAPIVIWNPTEDAGLLKANALHRRDPNALWLPREGATIPWAPDERVSGRGFRGSDPRPEAGLRVLILGDSSTFGYGVSGADTYGDRLEVRLDELYRAAWPGARPVDDAVQVLNGGVVGSSIVQGLGRYREVRREWRPDLVVEAFGVVNEHWPVRGLDDREKISFLQRLERERRAQGWLARLPSLARERLRLLHLVAFAVDQTRGGRIAQLKRRAKAGAAPAGAADRPRQRRVTPEEFERALDELLEEIRSDGAELVLLRMPRRTDVEESLSPVRQYDAALRRFAERVDLAIVDAHADFRASGLTENELFCDDYHPSPVGHERIAALLSEALGPYVLDTSR